MVYFSNNLDKGIELATSYSLKALIDSYYYGIFYFSLFLMFGFIIFVFSLLFLQNKYYFEENYKTLQKMRETIKNYKNEE